MASTPLVRPNLYQLIGGARHVSYLTHSGPATPQFPQGPPHFTYQDASQTLSFSGSDMEVVKTALGQIVSVRIHVTVDAGSTTFSVVIPWVNLIAGQPTPVHTEGITGVHRFSLVPSVNQGQQDIYTVTRLHGTASNVIAPL
jgi:hypothetical protein